jgi:hypothetical protein
MIQFKEPMGHALKTMLSALCRLPHCLSQTVLHLLAKEAEEVAGDSFLLGVSHIRMLLSKLPLLPLKSS